MRPSDPNRVGGSNLRCRGQEASHSALDPVLSSVAQLSTPCRVNLVRSTNLQTPDEESVDALLRSIGILDCQFLQAAQIAGHRGGRIPGRLVLQAHVPTEALRREHLENAVPVTGLASLAIG